MSGTTGPLSQRVVFLDRDGTINVDYGFVGQIEQWEFLPRAIDALQLLQHAGFTLAIVTNQSGIAAGRYGTADVELLHRYVFDELRKHDVDRVVIAYCPHSADAGCDCRKPAEGMAHWVETQLNSPIDYCASWMIGDKPSDVQFGQSLGTSTVLLNSCYWTKQTLTVQPTFIAASLLKATKWILD